MSATESPAEILERLAAERQIIRSPAPPLSVPIGITGSRNLTPSEAQLLACWTLFDRLGGTELHHGDCNGDESRRKRRPIGVDMAVDFDARRRRPELPIIAHPANWYPEGWDRSRGPYRPAGPIRNEEIARICRAAIAFPGNVGTASCIRAFHRLGKKVFFVQDEVESALEELRKSIERDHIDLGVWS